ncbi:MAG: hypothetical protein R3C29_13130 [Dehalococcoidia bacterium]
MGHYADEHPTTGAIAVAVVVGLFGALVAATGSLMSLPLFALAGLIGYGAMAITQPPTKGLGLAVGTVAAGLGRVFLVLVVAVAILGAVLAVYFLWEFLKYTPGSSSPESYDSPVERLNSPGISDANVYSWPESSPSRILVMMIRGRSRGSVATPVGVSSASTVRSVAGVTVVSPSSSPQENASAASSTIRVRAGTGRRELSTEWLRIELEREG